MIWTDERIEKLKTRWAEGKSATQIAGELRGVTRNAVIGKIHRLGLNGRPAAAAPQKAKRAPAPPPRPRPLPEILPVAPVAAVVEIFVAAGGPPAALTLRELTLNTCRFPVGDPGRGRGENMRFCGEPVKADRPYCPACCAIAFRPAPPMEPRRKRRLAA